MENSRKETSIGKELIPAMILCVVSSLTMFASSAWAYFHKSDLLIEKDSVPIATYNGVLDLMLFLATHMTLYLGVAFFCIGYLILKAYRKHKRQTNI